MHIRTPTDRGAERLSKCGVAKALYEAGLADARVADENYFEYALGRRVMWHVLFWSELTKKKQSQIAFRSKYVKKASLAYSYIIVCCVGVGSNWLSSLHSR